MRILKAIVLSAVVGLTSVQPAYAQEEGATGEGAAEEAVAGILDSTPAVSAASRKWEQALPSFREVSALRFCSEFHEPHPPALQS